MKKKWKKKLILAAMLFSFCLPVTAFSNTVPEEIRVGLSSSYKNVASVPLGNTEISVGYEWDGSFVPCASAMSSTGFSIDASARGYLGIEKSFLYYDDAKDLAEECRDSGFSAYPAFLGEEGFMVYVDSSAATKEDILSFTGYSSTLVSGSFMELKGENSIIMVFGPDVCPQFTAEDNGGILKIGSKSYRGRLETGRYQNGQVTAVNVVDLEEYLYGVVPSEMPSSYEKEALKAQAVAARSYILTRIGVHSDSGYDVCDGTNCQVYHGYGQEMAATNTAVDETKGIIAYYDGQPINAVFCASSGGYTENSEDVWTNEVPYLRAVPELNEIDANTWTRTFTTGDLTQLLTASGENIGQATDIVVSEIGENGRVQELVIKATGGSKVLTNDSIRTFFSGAGGSLDSKMFQVNGVGSGKVTGIEEETDSTESAASSLWDMEAIEEERKRVESLNLNDSYVIGSDTQGVDLSSSTVNTAAKPSASPKVTGTVTGSTTGSTADGSGTFVFTGSGSGHGVGMSQKGANGMAKLGYSYIEILEHYYTGIAVE